MKNTWVSLPFICSYKGFMLHSKIYHGQVDLHSASRGLQTIETHCIFAQSPLKERSTRKWSTMLKRCLILPCLVATTTVTLFPFCAQVTERYRTIGILGLRIRIHVLNVLSCSTLAWTFDTTFLCRTASVGTSITNTITTSMKNIFQKCRGM